MSCSSLTDCSTNQGPAWSGPCLPFKPISSLCLAFYSQTPPSHCSFHSSKTLSSFLCWHLLFPPPGTFCPQILRYSGLFLLQIPDQMLGSLSIDIKPATSTLFKSLPVFAPWLFPSQSEMFLLADWFVVSTTYRSSLPWP